MKRFPALSLLLALAVAAGGSRPQDRAAAESLLPDRLVEAVIREGLQRSRVMEHLDRLTNGIGPRLTGSDAFLEACRWAKKRFESYGLRARLEKWAEWPRSWNRGQWSGRILEPESIELQVATYAWTVGTKGRARGEVVPLPRSKSKFTKLRGKLRGKWLFGPRPSKRSPYGRYFWQAVEGEGILGIVTPAHGDRKYPNRIRVFGRYRNVFLSAEERTPFPVVYVRADQAARIEKLLKKHRRVVAEFEIRNRWRDEPVPIYNVIADLPGRERPDEYVIVCGHLDSWHQATGTTDNGTGVATTIEAARILAKLGVKPRRTIRFILWGGEEQGLLGSRAYVEMHRDELPRISAVYNHDTGTNWAWTLHVTEAMAPVMRRVVAPLMRLKAPDPDYTGPVFKLRVTKRLGRGGGSDHASFLAAGVPAFPWGLRGRSDYFGRTWHSQWDTYDEAVPAYLRHTSVVVALTALGTAELPDLLPRGGLPAPVPRAGATTPRPSSRPAGTTSRPARRRHAAAGG